MDSSVRRQFRVEGRGHRLSLLHDDRIFPLCGEDFHVWTDALDLRSANKDHLDGNISQHTLPDRAVELASVGVAANADVERAESCLLWVLDFIRQQNRSGAGTKRRLRADE